MANEDVQLFCAECGYDLTGLVEMRCPECGEVFDRDELARTMREAIAISLTSDEFFAKLAWPPIALFLLVIFLAMVSQFWAIPTVLIIYAVFTVVNTRDALIRYRTHRAVRRGLSPYSRRLPIFAPFWLYFAALTLFLIALPFVVCTTIVQSR